MPNRTFARTPIRTLALVLLLAAVLSVPLAGCASATPTPSPAPTTTPMPEPTLTPAPTAEPAWVIPADRAGLTADQQAVYDAISEHLRFLPPVREFFGGGKSTDGWSAGVHLEAAVGSDPGRFMLTDSGFLTTATDVTVTLLPSGTTYGPLEAAMEGIHMGDVDVAAAWVADRIRVDYKVDGVAKNVTIDRYPDSPLTREQVLLLVSVDPDAEARYRIADASKYEYLLEQGLDFLHSENGLKMGWYVAVLTKDATDDLVASFYVRESPLAILPLQ